MAQASVAFVSVEDEPMHHELLRTPTVRVLRANFPARSSCLWHEHTRYTIYICITELDVMEHKMGQEPTPLRLEKGALLCRDHAKYPLIHTATTKNDDVVMVGVEFMRPRQQAMEELDDGDADAFVIGGDAARAVRMFSDVCSRVDRISLSKDATSSIHWALRTEAVLVCQNRCNLSITWSDESEQATKRSSTSNNSQQQKQKQKHSMEPGSAIPLAKGYYSINLVDSSDTMVTVFVVQVFSDP